MFKTYYNGIGYTITIAKWIACYNRGDLSKSEYITSQFGVKLSGEIKQYRKKIDGAAILIKDLSTFLGQNNIRRPFFITINTKHIDTDEIGRLRFPSKKFIHFYNRKSKKLIFQILPLTKNGLSKLWCTNDNFEEPYVFGHWFNIKNYLERTLVEQNSFADEMIEKMKNENQFVTEDKNVDVEK